MDKNYKLCEQIKVLCEQTRKFRRMKYESQIVFNHLPLHCTVFTVFFNVGRGSTTHAERTVSLLGTRGTKSWSTTTLRPIKHFRVASLPKRGLLHNHSYENEFNLYVFI